jgi:hypothetical protein
MFEVDSTPRCYILLIPAFPTTSIMISHTKEHSIKRMPAESLWEADQ